MVFLSILALFRAMFKNAIVPISRSEILIFNETLFVTESIGIKPVSKFDRK